jgi:hypothetical protein
MAGKDVDANAGADAHCDFQARKENFLWPM